MSDKSFEDLFFGWILWPVAIIKWFMHPLRMLVAGVITGAAIWYFLF